MSPTAAKPALLRAINTRATFELVHARGPMTHPAIVDWTGLSKPTVTQVLGQLIDRGLFRIAGRTRGLPGPTAQLYDVNPHAAWVLCLDIGREWLRAALTDLNGRVTGERAVRTSTGGAGSLIGQLRRTALLLTEEAGISLTQVTQAVVGTPGVIRPGEDHFSLAPQLPGWESSEVIGDVRAALVAPVRFENDVNLAALGELSEGCAQGRRDFVLLWIGTGVGMGVILDGELRRGAAGLAGEIGYLRLDRIADGGRADSPPTWGAGAYERHVSAPAIVAVATRLGLAHVDSAEAVFALARSGSTRAAEVVAVEARRLASAVAAVAAVLDPELVVIGGGVGTGGGDLLVPQIADVLRGISPFTPQLAVSRLGSQGVLAGARALGMQLALDRLLGDTGRQTAAATGRAAPGAEAGSPARERRASPSVQPDRVQPTGSGGRARSDAP